jgi:hypothetical protein
MAAEGQPPPGGCHVSKPFSVLSHFRRRRRGVRGLCHRIVEVDAMTIVKDVLLTVAGVLVMVWFFIVCVTVTGDWLDRHEAYHCARFLAEPKNADLRHAPK